LNRCRSGEDGGHGAEHVDQNPEPRAGWTHTRLHYCGDEAALEAVTKAAPGSAPDWGAAAMELSADLGFPVGFSIRIGHDGCVGDRTGLLILAVESLSGASPVAGCVLSHPVWRSSSVSSAAEAPWPMALRASSPCCSELLMQFRDKLTLMRGVAALV
jgi:hypothetical protein